MYRAFYKTVLGVAVPIMIQNGITNFVGLLDNIMVGRIGTEQMSGIATGDACLRRPDDLPDRLALRTALQPQIFSAECLISLFQRMIPAKSSIVIMGAFTRELAKKIGKLTALYGRSV